jgi:ATP-dependent protease ClpP protease subunit
MKTKIEIKNEASVCTIDIEGVIGVAEESQFSAQSQSVATYEKFRSEVEKIRDIEADEVVVNIRSTGGDVNDALLIYEMLTSLGGRITTRCYGYTASAATIIAQAASEGCREIASSALYLIHKSSCATEGNASDMKECIDLLEKSDERLAALYAKRSGHPVERFEELMSSNGGRGRWLSPEEVVEMGLADVIIGEERQRKGLVERIKGWLNLSTENEGLPATTAEMNILHLPHNLSGPCSALSLREGQEAVSATQTLTREDPSLEGTSLTHNALAYAEDALKLKGR